jgi:hypothetical protein
MDGRGCQTAPAVYRTDNPMWAFELLVSMLHPAHFCFRKIHDMTRTVWTCFLLADSHRLLTATVQVPTHFMSYGICVDTAALIQVSSGYISVSHFISHSSESYIINSYLGLI